MYNNCRNLNILLLFNLFIFYSNTNFINRLAVVFRNTSKITIKEMNIKSIQASKQTNQETVKQIKRTIFYFVYVFTALEDSLLYSPRPSYLAVVAIDFGTTYSGFAFSFIKDQGKDAIFMNMVWANEQGGETSKTPTCLLLKPDLSFDSFGYDAIEKYAGLQGDGEEKQYLFFKHFKMALHSDEVGLDDRIIY